MDLTLLFVERRSFFAHTMISLERRRELWDDILALPSVPIESVGMVSEMGFSSYMSRGQDGESKYGETKQDPYGSPLRAVLVSDFAALKNHTAVQDNDTNRAAGAFMAALDPRWYVVLYWQ